jgi:8-amino-7-oxononanoate synthase
MEGIEQFLCQRQKDGLLRRLREASFRREGIIRIKGNDYLDCSSNDYLGFTDHPRLQAAAREAIDEFGTGAGASRLLSGDLEIYHRLEQETADLKGKEASLVFNSGYQANVGIISALAKKEDVIFSDKLAHASIIDGILLSGAKYFRFHHNDCDHLELLLKRERKKFKAAFIITETVFSMDGDIAPLRQLAELKEKYDCKIMVDEAHATGIFGQNGAGIVELEGLNDRIDFIMGTFSKALGSFGAYLASGKKVKDYLVNTSRSFIYSTALPPSVVAVNLAALKLIGEESFRRQKLLENARYFRNSLKEKNFSLRGTSQIVPLVVGESAQAIQLADNLQSKGWWVLPIRPPTVPAQEARLRFSLTYYHTKDMLKKLIDDICASHHI